MFKILLIDDEPEMLNSLKKILSQRKEFSIDLAQDASFAMEIIKENNFDLIITDLRMGKISGLDILRTARQRDPEAKVILISGYGTIEASVAAIQEGAFDFLEKPFTSKKLFTCIDRAMQTSPLDKSDSEKTGKKPKEISGLIYQSKQIDEIINMIHKIAPGEMSVLITGESGTGKELIARAIHSLSKRLTNPFVPVNCSALPEHLFESELFGHERGAFTGAVKTKPGLIEFADQGTFFFDEIGDLSLQLQVKLLRMLEDRQIRRVGGQKEIAINVRIIAATNKDIGKAVREEKFREDLYYRLNTIPIEIPPLRERIDDILPLAYHFLNELSEKNEREIKKFTGEAEESLTFYAWPGNVRELQNIISRAYFLCSSSVIQNADIPLPISSQIITLDQKMLNLSYKDAKDYVLEKFEIEYLTHQLKKYKGNISKTANSCSIDRRSIHRLIKKYNIFYQDF
jgi:DNA-binding NtrC family response regulator